MFKIAQVLSGREFQATTMRQEMKKCKSTTLPLNSKSSSTSLVKSAKMKALLIIILLQASHSLKLIAKANDLNGSIPIQLPTAIPSTATTAASSIVVRVDTTTEPASQVNVETEISIGPQRQRPAPRHQASALFFYDPDHQQQQVSANSSDNNNNNTDQVTVLKPAEGPTAALESSPVTPKSSPVLRPSLEKVASALSRKHLNLEHQNWRLKQSASVSSQRQMPPSGPGSSPDATGGGSFIQQQLHKSAGGDQETLYQVVGELSGEAEREFRLPAPIGSGSQAVSGASGQAKLANLAAQQEPPVIKPGEPQHWEQNPSVDDASIGINQAFKGRPQVSPSSSSSSSSRKQHDKSRRGNSLQHHYRLNNDATNDEDDRDSHLLNANELQHCQHYLQLHSSPLPSGSSGGGFNLPPGVLSGLATRLLSSHQLPCSCESRRDHFEAESGETIWLSCDHVQLLGSHFYNTQSDSSANYADGANRTSGHEQDFLNGKLSALTRFSQRASGLQTLHSQKFHYLQLFNLKSIDLSGNRIRQIKMDAFHGLEDRLEYLNLADNLLGDSRAIFTAQNQQQQQQQQQQQNHLHGVNIGKLIFASDELNRLKKLKWLSLHNNLINHLSPSIFTRAANLQSSVSQTAPADTLPSNKFDSSSVNGKQTTPNIDTHLNELVHLDLSENLLKSIPSESIHLLSKLETLNLNRNRISQLDQASKFPRSLKYLDLSENLIRIIRHCDLIDLPNLIELNLSHNQLSHLDKSAFLSSSSGALSVSSNLLIRSQAAASPQASAGLVEPNISSISGTSSSFNRHEQQQQLVAEKLGRGNVQLLVGRGERSFIEFDNEQVNLHDESSSISGARSGRRFVRRQVDQDLSRQLDDRTQLDGPSSGQEEEEEREKEEGFKVANQRLSHKRQAASENENEPDDLDIEESIISSLIAGRATANGRQTLSDELNLIQQQQDQFNSTLMLNLSHNFFEQVPGDSLLKFSNLQQLDLSFNRIRKLDSNYLCSIYNLVDNLRQLDLSGNLMSVAQPNSSSLLVDQGNERHLNKLFGCLQKLEKLSLSTNRLASSDRSGADVELQLKTRSEETESTSGDGDLLSAPSNKRGEVATDDGGQVSGSNEFRLKLRFGETIGNRHLNSIDLSDNQLRLMPIIEQVNQQPIVLLNMTNSSVTNRQAQLNEWMNSRNYLEVLNLNYNYLERLEEQEFEHLFNLRQLHLDFNKLSHLPVKLMRRFTSLDRLSLNGNRISSLEPLNDLLERSVRTLRVLNLANNRILEWPQLTKYVIHDNQMAIVSSGSTSLSSSSSSHYSGRENSNNHNSAASMADSSNSNKANGLQVLEFALEELNLEGNQLTSSNISALFDQLVHMKSLKTLNLSHNLLNRIRSEWFKFANRNLRKLLLSGNKINNIDLGSFALNQANELLQLSLDSNLLKELRRKTFDSLAKLRELNLANNLIHTINSETFHQLNGLQILRLNNNKLTSWKCEYFSNLCNSISGNINADLASILSTNTNPHLHLDSIDEGQQQRQVQPVSSLIELDLSYNSLSQLRGNSISVHTKLVRLNLEHNKLSFIPHDLFKATTTSSAVGRQIQLVSSLRYLNLAHNRIQTIDNINFKPLRNLLRLDLAFNELQTLGIDVVLMDSISIQMEQNNRKVIVSNNPTNLIVDDELYSSGQQQVSATNSSGGGPETRQSRAARTARHLLPPVNNWPALSKLRHLNLAHNQLTTVNQSLLSELSPFALLNLNLSANYLDSESLPYAFYTKITGASRSNPQQQQQQPQQQPQQQESKLMANYDMIFTLKLESLDLSFNRLNEFPNNLLDNHYTSMESCNLAHNRIQNLNPNSNVMIQIKSLSLESNPLSRESNELILFEQKNIRHLNLAATRLYAIQRATTLAGQLAQNYPGAQNYKYRIANQTSQLDLIRSISRPIDAPYLRHLNLSSNQLVWLAANVFDRMHSLETLDLSNNQLTRLNLLNNQLSHVSSSLEYLNLGSNLFTNLDKNDLGQLTQLRHLDLSNLLSLRKVNCKFLLKLTTLKTLRMFHYPQLRQNLASLLNTLSSLSNQTTSDAPAADTSRSARPVDRLRRKIMEELEMSTIGKHCFRPEPNLIKNLGDEESQEQTENDLPSSIIDGQLKWYNLEELELEMFNNFSPNKYTVSSGGDGESFDERFILQDELLQLLGPQTRKLTLIGLNLTNLADNSLLGILNDEMKLKISYTSLGQLPLGQILGSVAKRTKLQLDFRNNNIQSIDTKDLQMLDELQLNNQVLQHGDHSSLKLAFNPIRCDCQTRPLWLWLNQRWENVELASGGDEQLGDTSTVNNANYWLKFNAISQASDMRCYYPLKLRGKLTQHVNYNDLVCKTSSPQLQQQTGSIGSSSSASSSSRQSRKRNETRSSDHSYYLTSLNGADNMNDSDELDEDEFLASDFVDGSSSSSSTRGEQTFASVKVTKFNRYPPLGVVNNSLYFLSSTLPVIPFIDEKGVHLSRRGPQQDEEEQQQNQESGRIGKRDENSNGGQQQSLLASSESSNQPMNTNYYKYRPNTHQRHGNSHLNTLSNFNPLPQIGGGKTLGAHHGSINGPLKRTFLTESDVFILTAISGAMIFMSFIIIAICLIKYQMDQNDSENMMGNTPQGKLLLAQALIAASNGLKQRVSPGTSGKSASTSSSNSPPGSRKISSSNESSTSKEESANDPSRGAPKTTGQASANEHRFAVNQQLPVKVKQVSNPNPHPISIQQQRPQNGAAALVGSNQQQHRHHQNFLMRSPTIRRVHGLATNASDWFKFTLRAYPAGVNNRRRELFTGKSGAAAGAASSQLSASQLAAATIQLDGTAGGSSATRLMKLPNNLAHLDAKVLPASLATGCPIHAFKGIHRLRDPARGHNSAAIEQCLHCSRLLGAIQQTRYLVAQNQMLQRQQQLQQQVDDTLAPANNSQSVNSRPSKCADSEQQATVPNMIGSAILNPQNGAIENPNCYIPPSLIKALAREFDQQQQQQQQYNSLADQTGATTSNWQNQPSSSSYCSRKQQVKSMRTFGFNNSEANNPSAMVRGHQVSATMLSTTSKGSLATNQMEDLDHLLGSQIPTIDVDGRFAYQTESQIESSAYETQEFHLDTRNRSTPVSSMVADDQNGMFVLVHDSQSCSSSRSQTFVATGSHAAPRSDAKLTGAASNTNRHHIIAKHQTNSGDAGKVNSRSGAGGGDSSQAGSTAGGSIMQDECSHSSSPVAYGFMRSSPSATTISSANTATTNHNNNNNNNKYNSNTFTPESIKMMASNMFAATNAGNAHEQHLMMNNYGNIGSFNDHHDPKVSINNNNTEYLVCNKEGQAQEEEEEADIGNDKRRVGPANVSDQQIIISRL